MVLFTFGEDPFRGRPVGRHPAEIGWQLGIRNIDRVQFIIGKAETVIVPQVDAHVRRAGGPATVHQDPADLKSAFDLGLDGEAHVEQIVTVGIRNTPHPYRRRGVVVIVLKIAEIVGRGSRGDTGHLNLE